MTTENFFIHFDSLNATYTNGDPFDCTFAIQSPIKNIKNIYLNSIELPYSFYNIRHDNKSTIFTIIIGGIQSTVQLTAGNYTAASLVTEINNKFAALSLTNSPSFALNGSKFVITISTSAFIQILPTTLSKILGFSSNQSTTGVVITAANNYNLAYDSYISMYFKNLPTYNIINSFTHFKIELNGNANSLIYSNSNLIMKQGLNFSNSNFVLNNLQVQFYDRFGFQILTNNGLDYSFSLIIEMED